MTHTVRPISRLDVQRLSVRLTHAFLHDPVLTWILADRMEQDARRFFRVMLNQFRRTGYAITTAGLEGAALWLMPGTTQGNALTRLVTYARMAWLFRDGFRRSLRIEQVLRPMQPSEPHWYLSIVGTAPEFQGCGVGKALMLPVLERCDVTSVPAYLESSNRDNIGFYEMQGFKVVEEVTIPGGPTLWPMLREPRPHPAVGATSADR